MPGNIRSERRHNNLTRHRVCSHCGQEFMGINLEMSVNYCSYKCYDHARRKKDRDMEKTIAMHKGHHAMSDAAIAKAMDISERQVFRIRSKYRILSLSPEQFAKRQAESASRRMAETNRCPWPKVDTRPSDVFTSNSFSDNVIDRDFRVAGVVNPYHEVRSSIGCASAMAAGF